MQLNLVSTFGKAFRVTKKRMLTGFECHWLPKRFNKDDEGIHNGDLYRHFSVPALHHGFALRIRHYQNQMLHFRCDRGRNYSARKGLESATDEALTNANEDATAASKKLKLKRVPTTSKPVVGCSDRCPFHFRIGWSSQKQRWYIPKKQEGDARHLGHMWLPTQVVNARAADLTEDERILQTDVAQAGVNYASHEKLLQKRNSFSLSAGKLKYLRQTAKELFDDSFLSCIHYQVPFHFRIAFRVILSLPSCISCPINDISSFTFCLL